MNLPVAIFDGSNAPGTGGAIRGALPELGDAFLVLYGDSYLDCDYAAIERAFATGGKSGLMTVDRNDDHWDRSNVLFLDGHIVRYDKQRRTADMRHIDYGLGVLRRSAFEGHTREEAFDLVAVYQDLIAHNDLAGFEVPGRFYEIGSPSGLDETRAYLARKETPVL
jgi:prepilin-type processing-associated H-X9-DG protein